MQPGNEPEAPLRGLPERISALEAQVDSLLAGLRTRRLAVVDEQGRERVVAELVGEVAELRVELPARAPGRRTSLLLFAVPGQPDWCAGLGVQLWVDGDLVDELTWWEDGDERRPP